jgi:hypothetical protein
MLNQRPNVQCLLLDPRRTVEQQKRLHEPLQARDLYLNHRQVAAVQEWPRELDQSVLIFIFKFFGTDSKKLSP